MRPFYRNQIANLELINHLSGFPTSESYFKIGNCQKRLPPIGTRPAYAANAFFATRCGLLPLSVAAVAASSERRNLFGNHALSFGFRPCAALSHT
jgi:hypothetical protein